jgi:hypothetical protein
LSENDESPAIPAGLFYVPNTGRNPELGIIIKHAKLKSFDN